MRAPRRLPSLSPQPSPLRRTRGASRLEALIVVILIGAVGALLLERLTRYQEYAEKAVMEATIANMRSGLRVRVAELMISGRMAHVENLLQENPITWLAAPPPNYGGMLTRSGTEKSVPGNWYFDASAQLLVYLPQHRRFFQPAPGAPIEVRLRAAPKPVSAPLAYPASAAPIEGVSLIVITPFQWK